MASWQAKHRDPLFDQTTQAALERRGKEVVGAALVALGPVLGLVSGGLLADGLGYLGVFGALLALVAVIALGTVLGSF